MTNSIIVENLQKNFGQIRALDGLSFEVEEGSVHALLGPNGAGKTTAVRILSTLLTPDGGRASVCGADVVSDPHQVRTAIALTGQATAIDNVMTGRENLILIGRLRRLDRQTAIRRAAELLERFDLEDAADRRARTYSGGMKRRLDLAMSLITRPRVLFLDEPTSSLDPQSRHVMWALIERIARTEGTTVVLTTQNLEEADRLADLLTVIDHGKAIAQGTPEGLKAQARGDRVEVVVASQADLKPAEEVLRRHADGDVTIDRPALSLTAPVTDHLGVLPPLVRGLDVAGVHIADMAIRRPTLDDAFLALTGHGAEDQSQRGRKPSKKKEKKRGARAA